MLENFAFEAGEQYVVGGRIHILKTVSAGQILVKNLMTGEEEAHNKKSYGGNLSLLSFSPSVTQILLGDIKEKQITH